MKCKQILKAYFSDMSNEEEKQFEAEYAAHMESCDVCQRALAELEKFGDHIQPLARQYFKARKVLSDVFPQALKNKPRV